MATVVPVVLDVFNCVLYSIILCPVAFVALAVFVIVVVVVIVVIVGIAVLFCCCCGFHSL